MLVLVFSCNESDRNAFTNHSKKEIEVGINKTIETFMIVRALSDSDPMFSYRKPDYNSKPLMFLSRVYFTKFKNHNAVVKTQELISQTSSTGDVILQGLLYAEEFPSPTIVYELQSEYWKGKKEMLQDYLNVLEDFYIEANVEGFIEKNKSFYQGAILETKTYLDARLIPTMEDYFGVSNEGYKIILIPNSPFGMSFGAETTADNKGQYMRFFHRQMI